jgi:hypothetical protein
MEVIEVDVIALQVDERLLALMANVRRFVSVRGCAGKVADLVATT